MIINFLLIVVGFILLIKGADFLVNGSSEITKKLGIPEIIVGLTIVSIGTSIPELFVSITSALNGHEDMAIGNVVGSNLCNLLLILGLSATINPVKFQKQTKFIEIPLCIFITILFIILCNIGNLVSRLDSIILIVLFVVFLIYVIIIGKKEATITKSSKRIKVLPNIIYITLGAIFLKFGGNFVVDNSTIIAQYFNVSEKIIGLTIVAIGTSLPELVTSVTASIKGNSDIAIGNILGSNIFNFLLITGTTGLISPIRYNNSYNIQLGILLVSLIVLAIFPYTDNKDEMTRSNGITYLMLFGIYMILLFIK